MQSIPQGGVCLIVRKFSLVEKDVDPDQFQQITQCLEKTAEDDYIAIFGPLKGGNESMDMQQELERLGLSYLDDFYALDLFLPSWLSVAFAFRPQ
ncbi:hypothetical protein J2W42_002196 [Rhizobium tibeticum]|uniref:hypothetical protein n=1 Tax=Rhizobium tibeticum TaxID=501024 RepID=UPI00277D9F30|nr:hypothetical protein [Rhizobium tibeticum]MDP9809348.1 hypothetical protein [Rhizobium tibeticum]